MPHNHIKIKNILYIEDDEGLARLLQMRMERFGHNIDIAPTGEEGINKIRSNNYDVLIIDNYLPGISGLEILKDLELTEYDVPAIFLTSSGDERLALEALKLNAADYLIKDTNQAYLELLPSVIAAAATRVYLYKQNKQQEQILRDYAEKLLEREQQLNLALVGSEIGVWDWKIDKNQLFWTENLRASLELPKDIQPSIEYWFSRVHPDDLDLVKSAYNNHLSGKTSNYHVIFREKSRDGSEREWNWILARGMAQFDENGKAYRMLGTSLDFTAYKMLEQQLEKEKNNAEAANRSKSDFLATMSHEIRTPMNAIIGLADILSRTRLDDRQKEILRTMQSSSSTLMMLINDLLDISRIEANQVMFEKAPVDLHQTINEVAAILKISAQTKGLQLEVNCDNLKSFYFLADKLHITQIISNLCSNAIKFTDKGKVSITSECHERRMGFYDVAIHVKDSGIGIAENKLESIFEKFVQADQTITRRFGGTGLGLAISNNLAQQMGGRISVESEENKGSVFTLSLTLQTTKAPKVEISPSIKNNENNYLLRPKILLVEDYAPNIMVASLLLEDMGFNHEEACNGVEAVEKVKDKPGEFAVILMDVQMHAMDGLEATKIIREMEVENNWPRHNIIGLTAHALAGDREKCLNSGMDDYLSKPINATELSNKIIQLINMTRAAS